MDIAMIGSSEHANRLTIENEAMNYFLWDFSRLAPADGMLGIPFRDRPGDVEPWEFLAGRPFDVGAEDLRVQVVEPGVPPGVSFGAFDIPFASEAIGDALLDLTGPSELQRVPARIESLGSRILVLNALKVIDCVDESRSRFEKWMPGNEERPDKVGQYRMIEVLKIDRSAVDGAHFFRVWGWRQALVVSEQFKDIVESSGNAATTFEAVS